MLQSVLLVAQDDDDAATAAQHNLRLAHKADSLKSLKFSDKRKQLLNFRDILRVYRDLDIDSALVYADKALAVSQALADPREIATARINGASMHLQAGGNATALALLLENRTLQISDTLVAHTESLLSDVYQRTEQYDKAIVSGFAAAHAFERFHDSVNTGFCYLLLGRTYVDALDSIDKGLEAIGQARVFFRCTTTPTEYTISGLLLEADVSVMAEHYDVALARYLEAQQLATDAELLIYFPGVRFGLGKVYYFQQEYRKSIAVLLQAVDKQANSATVASQLYKYLGLNYRDLGEPENAIPYFELCLQEGLTVDYKNEFRGYLVGCYQQTADYQTAFELQQAIITSRDSLAESEQKAKVTEIIERYESEKKQLKIENLKQENIAKESRIAQQYYVIWGVVALALLLGIGGYLWLRVRQKLREGVANMETARLQQRFLRTQLNPHFFFHALSSIEGYIYTNEKKSAAAFLRNFSKLMRHILESSDRDFISLQEDVDMIREYLILQQLNNDFKFEYDIQVSDELNLAGLKIPPMLIQPFVENAILHGALNAEAGLVTLRYALMNERLHISIDDNGPGPTASARDHGTLHRSMSVDIVKQRIRNLSEVHGIEIHYSIEASEQAATGTCVVCDLPLIEGE